jgi:hypothetical protein
MSQQIDIICACTKRNFFYFPYPIGRKVMYLKGENVILGPSCDATF